MDNLNKTVTSRTEVARMARDLMIKHGLGHWTLQWSFAKTVFGECNYRTMTISLSEPLVAVNTFEEARNTVLHEIAHALTPGAHHGPRFMAKCREIGARAERCCAASVVPTEGKYKGACACPGMVFNRHKEPRGFHRCRKCHTRVTWMLNGNVFTTQPRVRRVRRPRFAPSLAYQLLHNKL